MDKAWHTLWGRQGWGCKFNRNTAYSDKTIPRRKDPRCSVWARRVFLASLLEHSFPAWVFFFFSYCSTSIEMRTLIYRRVCCRSSLADRLLMRGAAPGAPRELCMDLRDEIMFRCQSCAVLINPAGVGLLLHSHPPFLLLHFSPTLPLFFCLMLIHSFSLLRKREAIRGLLLELGAKVKEWGSSTSIVISLITPSTQIQWERWHSRSGGSNRIKKKKKKSLEDALVPRSGSLRARGAHGTRLKQKKDC